MKSDRLILVKPSPTLAMTAKANALKASGVDVINFSVGEPDYDTPENIKIAANEAIAGGKTKYTPVEGIKVLREAICNKFKRENNLKYDIENIVVSCGAKQVIFNAMLSTLNPGDEVIILSPYWVSYLDIVLLTGGNPVIVQCEQVNNFKVTPQRLRRAITEKTKWLILNSPNNPTGSVYSESELYAIAQVLLSYSHLYVLTDDIYEHIIFDNHKFITLAEVEPKLKDRILVVNGVSKSYSMTGWRIGYGACNRDLAQAMITVQSQSTSNACSISQYAAVEALNGPQDSIIKHRELFQNRRDLVITLLKEAKGLSYSVPSGAFYLFVDCQQLLGKQAPNGKKIMTSYDLSELLLEQAFVAVVDGEGFGAPGCFRISYAVSEDKLKEGCARIIKICKELFE